MGCGGGLEEVCNITLEKRNVDLFIVEFLVSRAVFTRDAFVE